MDAVLLASNFYSALATAVLFLHGLFILWVIFGALLVRSRPILRWLHIASLVWGILTELLPWPCPFDPVRELAWSQGGRRAIPGRISAALSWPACLSRYLSNRSDGSRCIRMRF